MSGNSGQRQNGGAPESAKAEAARRRRLLFRAGHRGIKEMDLLLGAYAGKHIAAMSGQELNEFEHLMSFEDNDLLSWFTGAAQKPPSVSARLFAAILACAAEKQA